MHHANHRHASTLKHILVTSGCLPNHATDGILLQIYACLLPRAAPNEKKKSSETSKKNRTRLKREAKVYAHASQSMIDMFQKKNRSGGRHILLWQQYAMLLSKQGFFPLLPLLSPDFTVHVPFKSAKKTICKVLFATALSQYTGAVVDLLVHVLVDQWCEQPNN